MGKQFENLNCYYGAPMGRHSYGLIQNCEERDIRLFKVELDNGGYDDGGAYWGSRLNFQSLYCAISESGEYRQFIDAKSRSHAALLLRIPPELLKVKLDKIAFGRYSAVKGYFGRAEPGYEISEFGKVLCHVDDYDELCDFAEEKNGH